MRIRPLILFLVALAPASLPGQAFVLSKTDGKVLQGNPVGLRGTGGRTLVFASASVKHEVPWTAILGLHGPAPKVVSPVAVHLIGGDELKGEIAGGDVDGESLTLRSALLGVLQIPLDRVQTVVFRERAFDKGPEDLAIGKEEEFDEALFQAAGRGLDVHGGEIERISDRGIYFAKVGEATASLYPFGSLFGLSIRGGMAANEPGDWLLLTRAGDRVRARLLAVDAGALRFATEFGERSLPSSQISALSRVAADRCFLSDLDPVRVEESGSDADIDPSPLFSFRRDRTVSGGALLDRRSATDGFLVVAGRTYAKGLGTHSKCKLTFRVPPGMTRFLARVAIDDEVQTLGVKGNATVVVRSGETVLFEASDLKRGDAPRSTQLLAVEPGSLLTLEVGLGKGLFLGDRVDWLSAVFLQAP